MFVGIEQEIVMMKIQRHQERSLSLEKSISINKFAPFLQKPNRSKIMK